MVVRWLTFILVLSAYSCNKSGGGGSGVEIKTGGIFNPISFWHQNEEIETLVDLGEYVRGSNAVVKYLQIKNNSKFEIQDIELIFVDRSNDYFDFEKKNNKSKFPGRTGTCSTTLEPKASCLIAIQFKSNVSGQLSQKFQIAYKNLVDSSRSTKDLEMTILSGTPASLVFASYKTNYEFGTPVTLAQIPVVERINPDSYEETLTILNSGQLTARNIDIRIPISEECVSKLDPSHPVSCDENFLQNTAYVVTNIDCPDFPGPFSLLPGTSCRLKVQFQPRNNIGVVEENGDIPEALEIVQYDSNLVINYVQDPDLNTGTLNAYFTSTSALIEGKLKSPASLTLNFNQTVAGNRNKLPFNLSNVGFQEGGIISFRFYAQGTETLVATCKKLVGSIDLACYDNSDVLITDRHIMPYTIRDTNNCMSTDVNNLDYIVPEASCFFDLIFQPSKTLTSRFVNGEITTKQNPYNFDLRVFYDSKWNGVRTERESSLFPVTGEAVIGAILELTSIQVDEDIFTPSLESDHYKVNIGRQAVYASAYAEEIEYKITFKNIGGSAGSVTVFKDGKDNLVPFTSGTTTNDLGTFYKGFSAQSSCESFGPNSTCTIEGKLFLTNAVAPSSLWDGIFYDVVTGNAATSYKKFLLTYKDGSIYNDTNLSTTLTSAETDPFVIETRVFGKMITKAILSKLTHLSATSVDADKFKNITTLVDDSKNFRIYKMTNMGTGTPSFVRLTDFTNDSINFPITNEMDKRIIQIVPFTDPDAPDLSSLNISDCTTHVNLDQMYLSRFTNPIQVDMTLNGLNTKAASLAPFASEASCGFLVKFDGDVNFDTLSGSLNSIHSSLSSITNDADDIYPRRRKVITNPRMAIEYFDGDILAAGELDRPVLAEPLASLYDTFGNSRVINKEKTAQGPSTNIWGKLVSQTDITFYSSGFLVADNLNNTYSGLLYRPAFSVTPPVVTPALTTPLQTHNLSELFWFRDTLNNNLFTSVTNSYIVDPPAIPLTQKPKRRFVKNYLSDFFNANPLVGVDQVVYLGSFPQKAGTYSSSFTINNLGATDVKILATEFVDPANNPFIITTGSIPTDNWGSLNSTEKDALAKIIACNTNCSATSASKSISVTFNASVPAEYSKILRVRYETQIPNNRWQDSTLSATTKVERDFYLQIQASSIATASAPRVKISYQNYTVSQPFDGNGDTMTPIADLQTGATYPTPSEELGMGVNESLESEDTVQFSSIIQTTTATNPDGSLKYSNAFDPELIYAKKRFFIKNPTAAPFDMFWSFKSGSTLFSTVMPLTPQKYFKWEGTCVSNGVQDAGVPYEYKVTLSEAGQAGDSCYLDVIFQARDYNSYDIRLNILYELDTDQWVNSHIKLRLISESQPTFFANLTTGPVQSYTAYQVNMGNLEFASPNLVYINSEPFIKYTKTISITNDSPLRGSLLATYHKWKNVHISVVPADNTYDVDGYTFIKKIFHKESNGTTDNVNRPKVTIEAKKVCLVGPDDAETNALFWADKGFSTLHTDCSIKINRYYPLSYMYRSIKNTDAILVNDHNLIDLQYYAYQRSSKATMRFFFYGNIGAPKVTKVLTGASKTYFDEYTNSQGSAGFKWNSMTVDNSLLGSIIGYRIFYNKNSSYVGSSYQINPVYALTKDVRSGTNYSGGPSAVFSSEFSNDITQTQGAYFYFSVAAIRSSPYYTFFNKTSYPTHPDALPVVSSSFTSLNATEYVSVSDVSNLELVVPPLGKEYLVSRNKVLDRSLSSMSLNTNDGMTYDEALTYCQGSSISIIKGSQTQYYAGKLINLDMWGLISDPTTGTAYNSNSYIANQYAHWVEALYNIPTQVDLYDLPDSEALKEAEMYPDLKMWYIKAQENNEVCDECTVPLIKGRNIAYDGSQSWGWTGYINRDLPFGQARCYYSLSP